MKTTLAVKATILVAWAIVLAACGGGSSPAPAPPALMPSAPPIGEVLFEDASVLRPLRDGAVYEYRGVTVLAPMHLPSTYRNTVSHAAAKPGETLESYSNWFNQGSDAMPLKLSGGEIVSRQLVDLDGVGTPVPQDVIELRSPIRRFDQYAILDRRFPEGIQDVDGDGKPEAVDIAAYRRVIGMEMLDLENLDDRPALRVEFVTLARVQLSRDGTLGPVVRVLQRTWYAEGVGIVKQQLELPRTGSPSETTTHTEQLMSWDGVTSGLGLIRPRPAYAPADTPTAGGAALQGLGAVVRHGQGAAVVSNVVDGSGELRRCLSLIGADGQVRKTALLLDWGPDGRTATLASVAGGIAMILRADTGAGYVLSFFDGDLRRQTPIPGVPLDLGPTDPAIAWSSLEGVGTDGERLWVLYRRFAADGVTQLLLRAFGPDAQPASVEYVLDATPAGQGIGEAALSASPRRIVAGWRRSAPANGTEVRTAVVEAGAAGPAVGALSAAAQPFDPPVRPSSAGPRAAMLWAGPLEPAATVSYEIRGVELSLDGNPIRTTSGPLDEERLGTRWQAGAISTSFVMREDADRIVIRHVVQDRPWSDAVRETALSQVTVIPRGQQSFPEQTNAVRTLRFPPELESEYTRNWLPFETVLLDDRLLMLGYADGNHLRTAVVWHR